MPVLKNTDLEFKNGSYTASMKEHKNIVLCDDDTTIDLKVDEVIVTVDGKTITLPTPVTDEDNLFANGKQFKITTISGVSATVKAPANTKINGSLAGTVSISAGEYIIVTATVEGDKDASTPVPPEYISHK